MNNNPPLLTIAIPTWNRARFLEVSLKQLSLEAMSCTEIEILVSDNASSDNTEVVVQRAIQSGLQIRYIRNAENIGSDKNIAQCFNMALGRYVQIMGDDDVLLDGVLVKILSILREISPKVLLLRTYGFDLDFRAELPASQEKCIVYEKTETFLLRAGAQISLISACIINKQLITPINIDTLIGCNLVQVHLVLKCLFQDVGFATSYEGYAVACKRNNSGGYSHAQVFVENLGVILDSYRHNSLSAETILKFESKLLKSYHPYYMWRLVTSDSHQLKSSKKYFDQRFRSRWEYSVFILPILILPKPLAWLWGIFSVTLGRLLAGGDTRRGLYFLINRLRYLCKRAFKTLA
jgi:abequosyltransferase